jgi:hypothetical protein
MKTRIRCKDQLLKAVREINCCLFWEQWPQIYLGKMQKCFNIIRGDSAEILYVDIIAEYSVARRTLVWIACNV